MKTAIATNSEELDGEVSKQAGRAPFYHIFEEGKHVSTVENPFAVGGGGAGFGAAKMLADMGVKKVIAEKFGGNMESAMKERGLDFEEKEGTIKEVIEGLEK